VPVFTRRPGILPCLPEKPEKAEAYCRNNYPYHPRLPYRTGFDEIIRAGTPVVIAIEQFPQDAFHDIIPDTSFTCAWQKNLTGRTSTANFTRQLAEIVRAVHGPHQ
jgi:hypothetical protein